MVIEHLMDNEETIPVIISGAVVCIMAFSIYVTLKYSNAEQYQKTRLNVFFSALASVAIIFVGFNIIMTSIALEYNQKFIRSIKTKEAVDKLWLYPNQLLQSSPDIRPEFLASFFMNNPQSYELLKKMDKNIKTPLTVKTIAQERFISTVMIQAWEDCLANRRFDLTPMELWLRSYLTWAQNPYFKYYYIRNQFGYSHSTQQLAELLFEYAENIALPVENPNVYVETVNKMLKDPRYLQLIHSLR